MSEVFVAVEWSKFGREIEEVTRFNSRKEANEFATWRGSRQFDFHGNFTGDPRWGIEVLTEEEWQSRQEAR